MTEELKDTTTDEDEVMRQAEKNAGLPPSRAKVQAPADAIDLQNRIDRADETPAEGLAKLMKHHKAKTEAAEKVAKVEAEEPKRGPGRPSK